MRVCLDIEFQDAIVCILGGGKVALRKTKQFLEAGATIYIHSIQYEPEFNTLHINKVDKDTFIHTLSKAKLAIACTNNKSINKEVPAENRYLIICFIFILFLIILHFFS